MSILATKKGRYFVRFTLVLTTLFLTLLVLEVACRLFLKAPPSVTIENLQDAQKIGVSRHNFVMQDGKMILGKGSLHFGLYLYTPTGIRLRRNVKALVKNHELSGKDVAISTNSLGYRYGELGQKTVHEFRILDLGDSITLADYAQADETYPAAIEHYMNSHPVPPLQGKQIEAINAGVGSIDLQNYFSILMESGLSVQPDIVVVGLYLNDADVSPALRISRVPPPFNKSHLIRLIFGSFDSIRAGFRLRKWESETAGARHEDAITFEATHRIADGNLNQLDATTEEGFNRLIAEHFDDWGYAWSEGFWKRILPLVDSMNQVCQEKNIRLVFLFFPVAPQVYKTQLSNEPQIRFEKEFTKRRIAHLDLLPVLQQSYKENQHLYLDHCHLTPGGNKIVGETIARFLIEKELSRQDAL